MATSFSGGGIRSTRREPPTMGKQAAASDKVNQLLAHGRWFSSGIPASSSTTKTGRHDIAEILLKVALNTNNQIKSIYGIINHKAVPVLQDFCLHYVLFQIDYTAVLGQQEWYLHNVFLCCEPLER